MHPEINLILNTRHVASTIKSFSKLENFFPICGAISMLYNIRDEHQIGYPVHYDDLKWWDWFRNMDASSPDKLTARWMVFLW